MCAYFILALEMILKPANVLMH